MVDRAWPKVAWLLVGVAVPLAVLAALLPLRHRLDNATMAMLLVVAIVAIGRRIVVEGMVGGHLGRLAILNPGYELLSS